MRLVYDIETDGLLNEYTKIHCIVVHNLDTGTMYSYSDDDNLHGSIRDGVQLLSNATLLVGHNIIGFDNVAIDRLYGTSLNSLKIHDTFVMSQVLRYKRSHKHGLAGWGEHLSNNKMNFNKWGFIRSLLGGQMQPQLGIWKRFIRSLLRLDRCSLSWASGRGLLEVYWGWTDAASAGDQEEVY